MRAVGLGLMVALIGGLAHAAGGSIVPAQADICDKGIVAKKRLVDYLASVNGLRWSMADDIATRQASGAVAGGPAWVHLADPALCDVAGLCSDADKKAVKGVRVGLVAMLNFYGDAYGNPLGVTEPQAYLTTEAAQLTCLGKEAPGQPTPDFNYTLPLRIRGTPDDLFYDRGQPEFSGASKASLSATNDGAAHSRADKITAVVGYPIILPRTKAPYYELIPYVGFNRDVSKAADKGQTINSDTADAGILAAGYFAAHVGDDVLGNWVTVRPDYLFDHSDHSAIESLNLLYAPVVNGGVNSFIRVVRDRDDFLSWEPLAELHWDNGWYVKRGTASPPTHHDFSRLGLKYGVVLTSDNANLPLTLTVTHTELAQLTGSDKTLSYFATDLSWSFDPKQYFSVDLAYTNGRREDTFAREQSVALTLSAKY
jgi:hypothetical protein